MLLKLPLYHLFFKSTECVCLLFYFLLVVTVQYVIVNPYHYIFLGVYAKCFVLENSVYFSKLVFEFVCSLKYFQSYIKTVTSLEKNKVLLY